MTDSYVDLGFTDSAAAEPVDRTKGRRVVKTARTAAAINEAARKGSRPLIRPVKQSEEIWARLLVFQNPDTGEVEESGDLRYIPSGMEEALDLKFYPHSFPSPYAAYLIPPDLKPGDEVWLEDLIEDVVGATWNQGPQFRLDACAAVWNGEDFELQYDSDQDIEVYIG